jgi:uncharacterized membrane protein HdeD (DUF308 family)
MNSKTNHEIVAVFAIVVGILILVYPLLVGYLAGIFLVIFGIMELINRGMS